jgi:glycosyltransferase involved in cell wall biosynthesis
LCHEDGKAPKVRIALDLTSLIARPTGVDRYITGLASSLLRFHPEHEYFLFINTEDRLRMRELLAASKGELNGAKCRVYPLSTYLRPARLFLQQIILPAMTAAYGIDIVHSPTFIMPLLRGSAGHLLTVHDMTSFLLPTYHPLSRRGRLYEAAVSRSIKRADLVSVPSQAVHDDVLQLVPDVPSDRIRVIPCGIDDAFTRKSSAEVGPVLERLGIRWPYILYVGTLDPRKNLPMLVKSFAQLVERGHAEHLALAGQHGWTVSELLEQVHIPLIQDRVHMLGYVEEADLPYLYSAARLFAYPSVLEGFGFPPLEAMACGVPVVASDSSSLTDNLAGAAALVARDDEAALTAAMERMIMDDPWRNQHIAAGLERAASYRWETFANATASCYEEIRSRKVCNHSV